MVVDLLGPSLDDLHALSERKFSLKTTIMLADQMVMIFFSFSSKESNTFTQKILYIEILNQKIF